MFMNVSNRHCYTPAFGVNTGKKLQKMAKESYANMPRKLEQFEKQTFDLDMAGHDDYTIEFYQGIFTRTPVLAAYRGDNKGNLLILDVGPRRKVLQTYLNLDKVELSERLDRASHLFDSYNK